MDDRQSILSKVYQIMPCVVLVILNGNKQIVILIIDQKADYSNIGLRTGLDLSIYIEVVPV